MSNPTRSREEEWQDFVARHSVLRDLWTMVHETEQTKYGKIVEDLEAQDKHRHELEKRLVDERRQWAVMSRYFSSNRRERCKKGMDALFAAADKVQLAWAERVRQKDKFEKMLLVCAQPNQSAFKWLMIRLGDIGDADVQETRLYNTLRRVRYYFGCPGGTYIFRHKADDLSHFDEAFMDTAWWDSFLKNNPNEMESTYNFCGLVPRTLKEYTARFRLICAKVLQLLGSIISFSGEASNELALFPESADSMTRSQLLDLHIEWKKLVVSDDAKLRWAQGKMRTHTLILECAYLFGRIGNLAYGLMDQMKPLAYTLELATGLHSGQLIEAYNEVMAHEGLRVLLRKRQVDQCLLIQSDIKEDIHDYFSARRYTLDPLHPLNRFSRLNVQSDLDRVAELSKLDEGDEADSENSHSESLDTPNSDSELSAVAVSNSGTRDTSAPEVSNSPAPEVSNSLAAEVSNSPAPEVSTSPAPHVSTSLAVEVSNSSAPQVSTSPASEISNSSAPQVSISPASEVSTSPAHDRSRPSSKTSSRSASPHLSDHPYPELWNPPYPGYEGPRRIEDDNLEEGPRSRRRRLR
ncbi:hypothetical protein E4U21_002894 [Claviceps maximensis]|nr:hypothetical protein E4U21_002894 [Claviceps maximensis]